ncbi:isoprenylcysteine carboxylmethyltransferase family protein [Vibrio cincinnatiensis]|uniref:methyltransferase family protein n=1 Tax=Vibrio cincinnatiensis TaxID=675 RepID=UPI0012ACAD3F|nr:isoprenylcysteine carboxylmethyltransferase family protein [Vibrio cincinnatiensis]MCG3721951.1 isoprenylcysteine carboxylmethyltransferase family protein [Vibrio cincinnatiensis]MCG3724386.1 isoprenylcysteine carboxylmethyltransferase family protein [Vibrio cincinnatiensis]MCG3731235.1 isoprenylcysteine carboxylmethyltransferase family protein [Vibrio cincinnatiensis]MCG3735043.1 isoprenylcysteine carboxylmethyltransferase family protein [Vibrio cincinnatiensis]MCG3738748.1 isoprenylcystei
MRYLELKIPPVAVFLIALVMANRLPLFFTFANVSLPYRDVAFVFCFILSGIVGLSAVIQFRLAKTTVNPTKPDQASTIVDTGIFTLSRNPMYLALLLLILGVAYWHQNGVSLLVVVGFVLYMNRFQIQPEERVLERLFGRDYIDYKSRVRRWI